MSDERDGVSSADTDNGAQSDDGDTRGQTAVVTRPLRPTGKRTRRVAETDEDTDEAPETDSSGSKDDGDGPRAKKKTAKKPKDGPGKGGFNPFAFVLNYLREVVGELRKVIWPNRKQMVTYTTVVLVFLVFMVALIGGVDIGLSRIVTWIFA